MAERAEEIAVSRAREELAELVNRAAYQRDRFLLTRRGRKLAAIVTVDDLERLERDELEGTERERPFALQAADYPVLAEIWDNEDDDVFDEL